MFEQPVVIQGFKAHFVLLEEDEDVDNTLNLYCKWKQQLALATLHIKTENSKPSSFWES